MCNLYHVSPKDQFEVYVRRNAADWSLPDYDLRAVGPLQSGVYVRAEGKSVVGQLGQWGMIRPGQPERIDYLPSKVPGKRGRPRSTNNARIETVATRPTFKTAWAAGQRCLIPAAWFREPNWQTGKNIWWQLKRADGEPWMLAGLWSEWCDPKTGEIVPNFTMLTTNCDDHPLLNRLHKPVLDDNGVPLPLGQQDKRSVIHIEPEDWPQWLAGDEAAALALIRPPRLEMFDLGDALRTDQILAAMGR